MPIRKREILELTLPVYWACYLFYGDSSGLEDGEQEKIDAFFEQYNDYYCVNVSDNHWFAHRNDCDNIGGDVATYTFYKRGTKDE